jgi:hypothetical protein
MKDYSTGEAQWLLESNLATPNHDDRNRTTGNLQNLEKENAACWISVFVLLIVVTCCAMATVAFSGHTIPWPKEYSSLPSRRQIAKETLRSLNTNWTATTIVPQSLCQAKTGATVLLLRHCDDHGLYAKDDEDYGDKHCSHLGFQRTRYLPTLFGTRWPAHPQFLFAQLPPQRTVQQPSPPRRGINYRQIETVLPLAERENLPIHVVQDPNQLASAIFQQLFVLATTTSTSSSCHEDNDGDILLAVVAWKHAFIPDVAAALGCGPDQGCPDVYPDDSFDLVWELNFILGPEKPKQDIANLVSQSKSSFLILQDDYGLLQKQTGGNDKDGNDDDDSTNDGGDDSSRVPQWTVYGSVTEQNFDPLAFNYHTHTVQPNSLYGDL